MHSFRFLPGAVGLALALNAGVASAAFINGSISFSDGFSPSGLPPVPTSSIVSQLNTFDVDPEAFASGKTGDFSSVPTATTPFDFGLASSGTTVYSVGGFTFTLNGTSNVARTSLQCEGGQCTDEVAFTMVGTVSGNGFETTAFRGNWTGNGSCAGSGPPPGCTSDVTGSWSSSLTALGTPVQVPEPGSVALVGLALAGMAVSRKFRA